MARTWLSYPSAASANCTVYLPLHPSAPIFAVRETMDGHSVIMFAGGGEAPVMFPAKRVMADLVPPPDPPLFVGRLNPNAPNATFSGAADPGSMIVIRDGAVAVATPVADSTGQWETTAPVDLTPGSHTLVAIQTDIFGHESEPSPACVLDVPEPPPPPEPVPEPEPEPEPAPNPEPTPASEPVAAPETPPAEPAVVQSASSQEGA